MPDPTPHEPPSTGTGRVQGDGLGIYVDGEPVAVAYRTEDAERIAMALRGVIREPASPETSLTRAHVETLQKIREGYAVGYADHDGLMPEQIAMCEARVSALDAAIEALSQPAPTPSPEAPTEAVEKAVKRAERIHRDGRTHTDPWEHVKDLKAIRTLISAATSSTTPGADEKLGEWVIVAEETDNGYRNAVIGDPLPEGEQVRVREIPAPSSTAPQEGRALWTGTVYIARECGHMEEDVDPHEDYCRRCKSPRQIEEIDVQEMVDVPADRQPSYAAANERLRDPAPGESAGQGEAT